MPVYSSAEIFNNRLMVHDNIITNLIFNIGFMYSDLANYFTLNQVNLYYWYNVGVGIGDFMIRFWYRTDFMSVYVWPSIDDCDLS